jgi:hypothetical protein
MEHHGPLPLRELKSTVANNGWTARDRITLMCMLVLPDARNPYCCRSSSLIALGLGWLTTWFAENAVFYIAAVCETSTASCGRSSVRACGRISRHRWSSLSDVDPFRCRALRQINPTPA